MPDCGTGHTGRCERSAHPRVRMGFFMWRLQGAPMREF